MLPFMKKDKQTTEDPDVPIKSTPYLNTSYDSQSNLIHVQAAFDPIHLQNVLSSLEEATGSNRVSPISTQKRTGQDNHAHAVSHPRGRDYDVFVSYAGADIKYVKQLVTQMEQQKIRVWFDQNQILCGDPHRVRIDQGLNHSRYTMIVLSPSYIQEERYWTHSEMNAAIENESRHQTQLIPIQYHLTLQQIRAYSALLASRKMIDASKTTPRQIAKMMRSQLDQDNLPN